MDHNASAEAARHERAPFGDAAEIAIDVQDAEIMEERGLGDEQVGDREAMPHAVVVGEVALEAQRPLEDVWWSGSGQEVDPQHVMPQIIVPG